MFESIIADFLYADNECLIKSEQLENMNLGSQVDAIYYILLRKLAAVGLCDD